MGAWLPVSGSQAPISAARPGTELCQSLGFGPFRIPARCRVVYVVDETDRRGWAYGTLAGHPESGEELFLLELQPDDTVAFTVRAFSRPASLLARAAGPLGHLVQLWQTRRYVSAMAALLA